MKRKRGPQCYIAKRSSQTVYMRWMYTFVSNFQIAKQRHTDTCLYEQKPRGKQGEKAQHRTWDQRCWTDQFVLLQVESLQFRASSSQGYHAFICDTVALTQVDVLQLAAVLSKLRAERINYWVDVILNTGKLHLSHYIGFLLQFSFGNKMKKWDRCFTDKQRSRHSNRRFWTSFVSIRALYLF